jgi:hypothetical protein
MMSMGNNHKRFYFQRVGPSPSTELRSLPYLSAPNSWSKKVDNNVPPDLKAKTIQKAAS